MSDLSILLVEDDKDARFLINRVIARNLPAAVSEITDGETALRRFLETGADLLIVDHKIPLLSGLDLIRAVRARDAAVPIILVSNTPTALEDAFGCGINHFLDKAHLLRDLPVFLNSVFQKTA